MGRVRIEDFRDHRKEGGNQEIENLDEVNHWRELGGVNKWPSGSKLLRGGNYGLWTRRRGDLGP